MTEGQKWTLGDDWEHLDKYNRVRRRLDALSARLVGGSWREMLSLLQECYPDLNTLESELADLRRHNEELAQVVEETARELANISLPTRTVEARLRSLLDVTQQDTTTAQEKSGDE